MTPDADPILSIYTKVWKAAEEEGAFVCYCGLESRGERGIFHPREGTTRKPWIRIIRPHHLEGAVPSRGRNTGPDLTDDELRAELMTLAHEWGHFQSWRRSKTAGGAARAEWEAYDAAAHRRDAIEAQVRETNPNLDPGHYKALRAANQCGLTETDRQRIVDEETTAWRYGREILEGYGYDNLHEYDHRAEAGPLI
jgi:hypothetical protein